MVLVLSDFQGNKMNNIDVVYTPWENLKKTGDMAVGQIGFKDNSKVRKVRFLFYSAAFGCLIYQPF